jgi:hypothetical protein
MLDFIDELLGREGVVSGGPPSPSAIDTLATRFGVVFPAELLKLWSAGGKFFLQTLNADMLGPTEILQLVAIEDWGSVLLKRGFVPVLDDQQSNYLAVVVRPPLAPRVIHMPHDDGPRLLYRNINGLAKALLEALESGALADSFFYETQGDYPPDAPRPQEDQDAARALMATDGKQEQWNYAAQLLDASNLPEWARLLETDHFVRRDVVARMRQMQAPAIRELLQRDQQSFEAFARAVAEAARSAGLQVESSSVTLEGGAQDFFMRLRPTVSTVLAARDDAYTETRS